MRNVYYTILVFVCLISSLSAKASTRVEGDSGFKDIKLNLMNGNFLSDEEINNKTQVTFGIAIAEDGTPTRSEERRVGKESRSRWSPYH